MVFTMRNFVFLLCNTHFPYIKCNVKEDFLLILCCVYGDNEVLDHLPIDHYVHKHMKIVKFHDSRVLNLILGALPWVGRISFFQAHGSSLYYMHRVVDMHPCVHTTISICICVHFLFNHSVFFPINHAYFLVKQGRNLALMNENR